MSGHGTMSFPLLMTTTEAVAGTLSNFSRRPTGLAAVEYGRTGELDPAAAAATIGDTSSFARVWKDDGQ